MKEYFTNTIEEDNPQIDFPIESEIQGDSFVYPYDIKEYTINAKGGIWSLSNSKAKILEQTDSFVKIEIITGKSGEVDLIYEGDNKIILPITIKSF